MGPDLTRREDVVQYMSASENEEDWNARCDDVKRANDGYYPGFWFVAINTSGVMAKIFSGFAK